MEDILPSHVVRRRGPAFLFESDPRELDVVYKYKGKSYTLEQLFKRTSTTSFLVVKEDRIIFERYFKGCDQGSRFTSMSVAKSFLSALVGIAIEEGLIDSVDDPITDYLPELEASGYNGVPIKHVLQMSSGIGFSEEYYNLSSDVYIMLQKVVLLKQPINDYVAGLESERPSGERFQYASADSQVLGMLLCRVTGKTLSAYLEEKIWAPLGMESDATWNTDHAGMEMAYGFLNVIARDYARFGRLYLDQGAWNGKQIVPRSWVEESVTPDSPHLEPANTGEGWGYQYQWWVPPEPDGEFLACGVFGQYIYVYPNQDLVIVKTSADVKMGDEESVAAFRAVADYLRTD
jgi:CubicO group peptidase (beta-lactamase class C family)